MSFCKTCNHKLMYVICKYSGNDGYYSKLIPGKRYEMASCSHLLDDDNYYIITLNNQIGLYLRHYFYTVDEIREVKLNNIFI